MILVMFSGGLDSTGMLWKILKEEKEEVHVHHMNLMNIEKRARAEALAVEKILHYVQKIRNFTYTESTHQYPCYNGNFLWDSDIVAFISGNICFANPAITKVAVGMTASDTAYQSSNRGERAKNLFELFSKATKIYPVKDMTKHEIYKMLPPELIAMTWSCRTPKYRDEIPIPCGKCPTCKELKEFKTKKTYLPEVAKLL